MKRSLLHCSRNKIQLVFLLFSIIIVTFMLLSDHQVSIQKSDDHESEFLPYPKLKHAIINVQDISFVESIANTFKKWGLKLILVEPKLLLRFTPTKNNEDIFEKYDIDSPLIITFFSEDPLSSIPSTFTVPNKSAQLRTSCIKSQEHCICDITTPEKPFIIHLVIIKVDINGTYLIFNGIHDLPEKYQSNLSIENLTIGKFDGAVDWYGVREIAFDLVIPKSHANFIRQLEHSRFISCNETRKALFEEKYPNSTIPNISLEKKFADYINEFKKIAKLLRIPFWIMSGITLGWYRQCGLIPYTTDIDIAMWAKDYTDDFLTTFKEKSFLKPSYSFGKPDNGFILRLNSLLDLCFIYNSQNISWLGTYDSKNHKIYKSEYPRIELCSAILLNIRVNVPCNSEAMINAEYGPDWFDPKPKYYYLSGAKNLKFLKQTNSEYWKSVVTWY